MNSLLVKKGDALNEEMARTMERPNVKSDMYDRDYQTGKNPFMNKREEDFKVPVKHSSDDEEISEPEEKIDWSEIWSQTPNDEPVEEELKQSKMDKDPEFLPPREDARSIRSEAIKNEFKAEVEDEDLDVEKSGSLLTREYDYSTRKESSSSKIASLSVFSSLGANVKVHDQSVIINLPRQKVGHLEIDLDVIHNYERKIGRVLNAQAKYAHMIINQSFDGVALEFLLV